MTPIAQRRLGFVFEQRSYGWIARESGIPRSTVRYAALGERVLPTQYQSTLRNLYQREAYKRLGDVGFSPHQARRFSSFAPASVSIKILDMRLKVQDLTIGAVGREMEDLDLPGVFDDYPDLWNEMYEQVLEGMQKSKKPWEELDYPKVEE